MTLIAALGYQPPATARISWQQRISGGVEAKVVQKTCGLHFAARSLDALHLLRLT
jgi:hypothetical protein